MTDILSALANAGATKYDSPASFALFQAAEIIDDLFPGGRLPTPADLRYKSSIQANLPLNWADIGDMTPVSYWYPQGFAYDDAGWLLIHYADSGNTKAAIVVYNDSYAYQGYFTVKPGGESIVATGSLHGGDLELYKRDSSGGGSKLVRHDIGSMPSNGTDFASPTTEISSGVGLQFARAGDMWLVEQGLVDLGSAISRTKWNIYDSAFTHLTSVYVPITVVGYQTGSSALYDYVPKIQGVAVQGGDILFSVGGSYIPATNGPTSPVRADLGVVRLSGTGDVLDYAVVRSDDWLQRMQDDGVTADRTENEGVYIHPITGDVLTLDLVLRPGSAGADSGGVLIRRHFDPRGTDYSAYRSNYLPGSINEFTRGVLRRAPEDGFVHPLTGVEIDDLSDLLDLMVDMQLPRMAYFSASSSMTPLPTMDMPPANHVVEILNHNNDSFSIRVLETTGHPHSVREYMIWNSGGTWTAGLRENLARYQRTPTPTVSELLSASVAGRRCLVSDSTVAASGNFGAIVAGGGSHTVPVYSDGTNWRIG